MFSYKLENQMGNVAGETPIMIFPSILVQGPEANVFNI